MTRSVQFRLVAVMVLCLVLLPSALAEGAFSTRDYTKKLTSAHFVLYYNSTGPKAVTPAFAAKVLELAEKSYDAYVTRGGFRPPRVLPVPIAIAPIDPNTAGLVSQRDLGFELYVQINQVQYKEEALAEVVAHEFFHVLQASYEKVGTRDGWAIEGTAAAAPIYVFDPQSKEAESGLRGHLSGYWRRHTTSLLDIKYEPGLFWYWATDRYGGIKYLERLLTWSEDVEWERSAQLAALQGGAPANTTFDTLYRTFVFDMISGKMPAKYRSGSWFSPVPMRWEGTAAEAAYEEVSTGFTTLGQGYVYYRPLVLPRYAFQLVALEHARSGPVDLTVTGDAGSLEAYVIQPGATLVEVLRDRTKVPGHNQSLGALPDGSGTAAARLTFGQPAQVNGTFMGRTLVLIMRTGGWGTGSYQVSIKPAAAETKQPSWLQLGSLPHPADSPGTPPALKADELTALKAGRWLTGARPLKLVQGLADKKFRTVTVTAGSNKAWDGEKEHTLPFPVTTDAKGNSIFPARAMANLLGFKVTGNRFSYGEHYFELTPGATTATGSKGYNWLLSVPPKEQAGDIAASQEIFFMAVSCRFARQSDTFEITCPNVTEFIPKVSKDPSLQLAMTEHH